MVPEKTGSRQRPRMDMEVPDFPATATFALG